MFLARMLVASVGLSLGLSPVSPAEDVLRKKFEFHGDFRLRLEQDWDSRRNDGTFREDRLRARVRVRLGVNYEPTELVSLGTRLRSGSDSSQQSPHVTILDFGGGSAGDADFNLDQWFLRARSGDNRFSASVGRDGLPFWKQNELFWHDDVTLTGLAGALKQPVGERGELTIHSGYFSLPVGMRSFAGNLAALQIVYLRPHFTVAGGWLGIEADPSDPDADLLLNGDGGRDYEILVVSAQARLSAAGRPLKFGVDGIRNQQDYAGDDQTDGVSMSIRYGSTASRGDWLAGYAFARIEELAVAASYAQDDWVRWGNGPQTRGSNFVGHELRLAYAATTRLTVVSRLYLVESITGIENGKRFRIDFDYKLKRR